jgi:hypothetical protein
MTQTRTDQAARDKVWELIRDVEVATLVTVDAEGHLRGRPMRAAKLQEFDGTLWFFTGDNTPKTEEIRNDERVLLAYSDPPRRTTSPSPAPRRWSTTWRSRRRCGRSRCGPGSQAGRKTPRRRCSRWWRKARNTGTRLLHLLHAYGYVKARLTGEPPKGGENDKVSFKRPA